MMNKQEDILEIIEKHFNIKLQEDRLKNGEVWSRLVSIQAKEDEGTWDTTATADLTDYKEDFETLKEEFNYVK